MAYDNEISSEVSLSKVLDQMLIDDTDIEVVKTFLRQHQNQIGEIYRGSAFVYDLYDLVAHPDRVDDYLIENMHHLSSTDMFYAFASFAKYIEANSLDKSALVKLRVNQQVKSTLLPFATHRSYFRGIVQDEKVAKCEIGLVELVNRMSSDTRDISSFIGNSYFLRSAMMPRTFLQLPVSSQYALVTGLVRKFNQEMKTTHYGRIYSPSSYNDQIMTVCCDILVSLMKQFLALNDIESFNWFKNVIGLESGTGNGNIIKMGIGLNLISRLPTTIQDEINNDASFEDVVFDMNMLDTEFDSTDLFLYIYLINSKMRRDLMDNKDMIEFFNPLFDWNNLEHLK